MSSLSVMLRELGAAIDRIGQLRAECGDAEVRMDAARAGLAAGIFYLRCLALDGIPRESREIALDGMRGQFNTLSRAVARLKANRRVDAQMDASAADLLEKADVVARSMRSMRHAA